MNVPINKTKFNLFASKSKHYTFILYSEDYNWL